MTDCWRGGTQVSLTALNCPVCGVWDSSYGSNRHEAAYVHMEGNGSNVLFYDSHVETVKYLSLKSNSKDIFGHNSK